MFTAVVVLPTPPFWFATHMTRRRAGRGIVISPLGVRISTARFASCAKGGASVSRETSASAMGPPASAKLVGGWGLGEGAVRRARAVVAPSPEEYAVSEGGAGGWPSRGGTAGIGIVGPTANPVPVRGCGTAWGSV